MTFQTFTDNFLIPLVRVMGILLVLGSLTIIIGRAIWIRWSRRWQFSIRYRIFKSKVDPVKAEWCAEAVKRELTYNQVKMKLFLAGFKDPDVYEMLYLFNQFSISLKGGKHGRQFKRSNQEDERGKYPDISSY